jgi:hypothetical protein
VTTRLAVWCVPRIALVIAAAILTVLAGLGAALASTAIVQASTATTTYDYDGMVNYARMHHVAGRTTTAAPPVLPLRAAAQEPGSLASIALVVATEGAEEAGSVAFRPDASHIFRDATAHLLEDTQANRAVIQGAIDPANLRSTITLPDGSTLARYFQTLPNGTQAWAEVRNGIEITNGGVNATPR